MAANLALNVTGAFYQAPFPALVRDLPKLIESERQVIDGTKSPEEHATLDMLERSKLSNISLMFSAIGSMLCILIALGICYAMGTKTVAENTKVYSVIVGFFGVVWVISSIPWFVLEQHRPGQQLPDNTSWLTVGPKQVWEAARNVAQLKQTFLFLAGYFLIADVYNTSGTIVNILQNEAISFDSITFCGLFALVYGLEFVCIMANQWIQQRFSIRPKWMFFAAAVGIVFTNLWGKHPQTHCIHPFRPLLSTANRSRSNWHLDRQDRLPQCLGVLVLPGMYRRAHFRLVLVRPDHDGRGVPSA